MRSTAAIVALLLGVSLAGCGGSSSNPGTPSTSQATTTATSPPTTTTAPTTTVTSTTTTAAGPPACVASELSLSFVAGQGATGHGLLVFALRNTSQSSCHTYGFPGIQFLDRAGNPLPTNTMRATHDFFGVAPLERIVLGPGQLATFRIGVTHGLNSSAGCTTAYGLQAIAPDDTATLRATIGNGGAYECRTATVTPLRPGRAAFP